LVLKAVKGSGNDRPLEKITFEKKYFRLAIKQKK